MKPEQQTDYIVQCIRESGAMYEEGARAFLAEHGNHVRAEVLAGVEARLAAMTREADQQTEAMENEGAGSASMMYAQHIGLRRARDEVRRMAGEEATATAATATASFFVAGCSYTRTNRHNIVLRFDCEHITVDPQGGQREAWGWTHRSDGTRRRDFHGDDDYPKWTAIEGGDRDA